MKTKAFSLLEVLITLVIISIVTAIAIGVYKHYKTTTRNTLALYDLKNLINDELSYYSINQEFVSFSPSNATQRGIIKMGNFEHRYLSNEISAVAKTSGGYANFCTKHKLGNKIYGYQSENDMFYWKKSPIGHQLQDSDCPNATPNDDFSGWHVLAQKR